MDRAEDLKATREPHENSETTSRGQMLRSAHAAAVAEIERLRECPGQLSTGINGKVGDSILEAGLCALTSKRKRENGSRQFVVAAPPGTGKTSHAIALMAASVRTAPTDDQTHGCLFVVDQIKKADDVFQQIADILPGQVAVWTTDHDVDCTKPTQLKVPRDRRFHVDQLEQHAIAVVTQAFLRGPRGHKALEVLRGDHRVPRELTIFDEQTREVEDFDLKHSHAIAVKEALQRTGRHREVIAKLEPLLDFIHIQSKKTGNTIETPLDDPQGWRVATDLAWFATEEAERFVRSNSEIKNLKNVFGFAAQMHKNCAFIYRRGGGENGSHFVAYVPVVEPTVTSILLDATADIDGVGDLCPWRTNVAVPQVRYDNLHIVHVEPYTRDNLAEYFQREPNRLKYTEHAQQVIRGLMPAGASGLVVCKQTLVDHGHFPNTHAFAFPWKVFPWKFEDRHLAVTWWGGHGIGVNDWKEADYVFHFGEHILPDRSMFALVQGLRMQEATTGMLGATKNRNSASITAIAPIIWTVTSIRGSSRFVPQPLPI